MRFSNVVNSEICLKKENKKKKTQETWSCVAWWVSSWSLWSPSGSGRVRVCWPMARWAVGTWESRFSSAFYCYHLEMRPGTTTWFQGCVLLSKPTRASVVNMRRFNQSDLEKAIFKKRMYARVRREHSGPAKGVVAIIPDIQRASNNS